ncbi:hypothetical protein [Pseudomonas asplenii]|uniref:hypothetical protein n=1 Tax=Pseudomonas asplenii TaxID=53407 RepID=UPI0012FE7BE2|nr:hypothetical protein [Pseudomonas asplenii]
MVKPKNGMVVAISEKDNIELYKMKFLSFLADAHNGGAIANKPVVRGLKKC